ncbi:Methylecgonone reductase [Symbiodinium microadriaticum]|uniref:Methylecgonone reductase n=1 Tax=Symbiodinium microadriaticum TaxID=2951 RepID=A0A1Q9F674_SYMMI|nr:Methylecgonone reductase [Symbiodinium microadriaticum]
MIELQSSVVDDVIAAALEIAQHYASQGVEGVKRGHALILGDPTAVLRCGHIRGHSDFRPEEGINILRAEGADIVRQHMNMDGMTLISTDGLVYANHVYANQLPHRGFGGSRTAASLWFSTEVPGSVVFMISQDSSGSVQKFVAGDHAFIAATGAAMLRQPRHGRWGALGTAATVAASVVASVATTNGLSIVGGGRPAASATPAVGARALRMLDSSRPNLMPGWYTVISSIGLNCRDSRGQKTGSVAMGYTFQVLELRRGSELGSGISAFGPDRIWGRAGVERPEWLALTDNDGSMNVEMLAAGQTKSLAVSNFSPDQLDCLLSNSSATPPMVNQLPFSISYAEPNILEENSKRGEIGKKYGKSWAQVALRWIVDKGSTEHFKEDLDIFSFKLSPDDLAKLETVA